MGQMLPRGNGNVQVLGHIESKMRAAFIDSDPLGVRPDFIEHRAGLKIQIDRLLTGNDGPDECPPMAWISVIDRYRTSRFPGQERPDSACGGYRVMVYQVAVARCAVLFDDNGEAPSADEYGHEALVVQDDAERMEWAVCAAMKAAKAEDLIDAYDVENWVTISPDQGVVGGYYVVRAALSR